MVQGEITPGFKWVVERLPDARFKELRLEVAEAMLEIARRYGYDADVAASFNELFPLIIKRD